MLAVGGLVLLSAAPAGAADGYPSKDVQIVVPNEPGGGLDLVARMLAKGITGPLGQSVIVLNRSGASGNVGTASVARAEADGHTLLLTGVGHLVSPLLHSRPGYEPLNDFVPVAKIADAPNVLVVHESLKGLGLKALLDDPRSRHGGLAFASAGYGHSSHLAAEVMMSRTGARWLHVPYRGTGPATKGLAAGDVQLMFIPAGSVQAVLTTGKVQALAVAHPSRLASLPAVPTLAELGVEGADFSQWYGLFAPAGTPDAVVQRLHEAAARFRAEPESVRLMSVQGLEPSTLDRAAFADFLAVQSRRLATLVKQQGVQGTGH